MERLPRGMQMPSENESEENEGMEEGGQGPIIDIPVEEIPGSENWKDGEVYNVDLSVRQVGRGKYEILSAEEEEPGEEKVEAGEEKKEGYA